MKKSIIIQTLIIFCCITLSLFAYHTYLTQKHFPNIQQQTQNAILEAKKSALQESLKIERVMNTTKNIEALLRLGIELHLFDRGEMPKALSDFNLPEFDTIQSIEMLPNMVFILHFRPEYHTQGSVKLAMKNPHADISEIHAAQFDCTTSDFKFLPDYLPNCRFIPK